MNNILKIEIAIFVTFSSIVLSVYTFLMLKAIENDYSVFKVLVIFIVLHILLGLGIYKLNKEK